MKTIEEVQILSASDEALLDTVKEVILKHLPMAKVVLYGSVARGTQHEDSDYDLFVLTDRDLSMAEERAIQDDIYEIELERDVLLSTIFCSQDRWKTPVFHGSPLRKEIEEEGIIL